MTDKEGPSIGLILEKLKTTIFDFESPLDQFQQDCLERENGLKEYLNICMEMITEHATAPGIKKKTKRQELKSEECVINISKYISELVEELDKSKIEGFCKSIDRSQFNFDFHTRTPFYPDVLFLIQNSFYTVNTSNIMWTNDVSIMDCMKISRGQLDLEELGKYIPSKIESIKKYTLPFLKESELFGAHYEPIKEALLAHKKKLIRSCNLLLMTTIEGMVRNLANFLIVHQELHEKHNEENYSSLNKLLRDVPWKEDFEIDTSSLSLLIGENKTRKEKISDGVNKLDETVFVNLSTRLDFLKDRFKDNRDMILHGTYQEYNKNWNLYLNLSALVEVSGVCQRYITMYEKQ